MKYKKNSDVVKTPVEPPSLPPANSEVIKVLTQPLIQSIANQELANDEIVNSQNAMDNTHQINEYNTANTYQNYYGRSLNGVQRSCPTVI
jgi:hypothetical protein